MYAYFCVEYITFEIQKIFFEICKGLTKVKTIWIILTEKPNQKKNDMFNVMQF